MTSKFMQERLDFFIIGAQKAGTTALSQYLGKCTRVQVSKQKEIHFFDDETNVNWDCPDYGRLHKHFDWNTSAVVRGEATPIYMFWPNAITRLHRYNPQSKLIIGLRHPVFRAHSQWLMNVSRGHEQLTFADATGPCGRHRLQNDNLKSLRLYSYIERGFYGLQISRVLSLFPKSQVLIYRVDHLWKQPSACLNRIYKFLNVSVGDDEHDDLGYISPYKHKFFSVMQNHEQQVLKDLFRDEIMLASSHAGIDLEDWLYDDYQEPMIRSV